MERYIKQGVKLEASKMKSPFLTFLLLFLLSNLLLFAISTSVWAGGAAPPNDDCEDAIGPLTVPSMTNGTTTNSTADTAPDCGGDGEPVNTTPGVWYTVVGTGNTMAASTCNETTDYDTELSVYCHECDDLTCIGGNDDNECDLKSDVFWCSQAGATYRVFVHGHDGATGNFGLA